MITTTRCGEGAKMGDCGLNVDFNAGVIDDWQRQNYQNVKKQPKSKSWDSAMRAVRKRHICRMCRTYPGDAEYLFGRWQDGSYTCFDCLCC